LEVDPSCAPRYLQDLAAESLAHIDSIDGWVEGHEQKTRDCEALIQQWDEQFGPKQDLHPDDPMNALLRFSVNTPAQLSEQLLAQQARVDELEGQSQLLQSEVVTVTQQCGQQLERFEKVYAEGAQSEVAAVKAGQAAAVEVACARLQSEMQELQAVHETALDKQADVHARDLAMLKERAARREAHLERNHEWARMADQQAVLQLQGKLEAAEQAAAAARDSAGQADEQRRAAAAAADEAARGAAAAHGRRAKAMREECDRKLLRLQLFADENSNSLVPQLKQERDWLQGRVGELEQLMTAFQTALAPIPSALR
jgi:hypothetical protein